MVSSKMCATTDRRVVPALAASSTGVLPLDAIYEILLRLPAKYLCRLRTVCRPWRSLLSDQQFIASHSARHTLIAAYMYNAEHNVVVDIIDLSGQSIKKVRMEGVDCWVRSMALDLVCVRKAHHPDEYRVLNVATGAMCNLSQNLAQEHVARGLKKMHYGNVMYVTGQVASMGDYKVVRVLYRHWEPVVYLFEICTLNSGSCWRTMQGPSTSIMTNDCAREVIDGVIYFLSKDTFDGIQKNRTIDQEWLVPFDLQLEKWRPSIRAPNSFVLYDDIRDKVKLANLNGSLVMVHQSIISVDLWFLMDIEKGLWIKQYSLQVEHCGNYINPLSLLLDGRIVMIVNLLSLVIHDPRTNTTTNVLKLKHCTGATMYTGNLLS